MNSQSTREGLSKRLQRLRYRRAFADSNVGVQIAAQLHALRVSRKLSQEKLAKLIGMGQARISLSEHPEYQKYNIKTLKQFAAFYDVALDVRFVSFKEFVKRIVNQKPEDLAPSPFDETEVAPVAGSQKTLAPLRDSATPKAGMISLLDAMKLRVQKGGLLDDQSDVPIDTLAERQGLLESRRSLG